MMQRQGLNSYDWKEIKSKIAHANIEQLLFMKNMIDNEMVKRNGQEQSYI